MLYPHCFSSFIQSIPLGGR